MEVFDIDEFISEIESRSAIWDLRSESYSDRGQKTKAWEEICIKFIPKFTEMSVTEKNNAATQIQRKWKSLRDCFSRELAKQKTMPSGSAASSRKEYIHFKQLSFLSSLSEIKRSKDLEVPYESSTSNLPSIAPTEQKIGRKRALSELQKKENDILENISENMKKKNALDEDADRSFLLSLLPDFKKIPEDLRLDAKTEFLNVIRKYKAYTPSVNYFGNQQHAGYYCPPAQSNSNYQYGYSVTQPPTTVQNPQYSQGIQREYNMAQNPVPAPSPALSDTISVESSSTSIIEDMFNTTN